MLIQHLLRMWRPKPLDPFARGYCDAALLEVYDGQPLRPSDIAPASLRKLRRECRAFKRLLRSLDLAATAEAGRRFWVQRNSGWSSWKYLRRHLGSTFPPVRGRLSGGRVIFEAH